MRLLGRFLREQLLVVGAAVLALVANDVTCSSSSVHRHRRPYRGRGTIVPSLANLLARRIYVRDQLRVWFLSRT